MLAEKEKHFAFIYQGRVWYKFPKEIKANTQTEISPKRDLVEKVFKINPPLTVINVRLRPQWPIIPMKPL